MEMTAVQSRHIVAVGYDPATSTLQVEFNFGTYQYEGVPEQEFHELRDAYSVGAYFSAHIRNSYNSRRV